jgi:MinD superfamily P-loop ATPase
MKQLLVLSGKGGTGKTTVASAFIKLSNAKAYADCDVDAPNLHLVTDHKSLVNDSPYFGMKKALIHQETCIECGACDTHCRFDAIDSSNGYKVDSFSCEGCGVCAFVCPVGAIEMVSNIAGRISLYQNDAVFSTAKLEMGQGNSGLLVTEVKKQLKPYGDTVDFAVIDGSPGIGCPVISSISGVDTVLVVAEPTLSGISDMDRIVNTSRRFGVKIAVCINKYDVNIHNTKIIEAYCETNALHFVGRIPYDAQAVKAINNGMTVVETPCPSGEAIKEIYHNVRSIMK